MTIGRGVCHAAFLVLVLTGCALYSEPGRDTPTADLIVSSNLGADPFAGANTAHHNFFYAFADAGCTKLLGALATFVSDTTHKAVRVEAGKRIYIRADWRNQAPAGQGQDVVRTCYNLVSFVPDVGERYEILQTIQRRRDVFGNDAICVATVRNINELDPTRSFQEHRFEGECARLIK